MKILPISSRFNPGAVTSAADFAGLSRCRGPFSKLPNALACASPVSWDTERRDLIGEWLPLSANRPMRRPSSATPIKAFGRLFRSRSIAGRTCRGSERACAQRCLLSAGSVRVTTTEALGYQLVAPAIAALRQAHPDLQVDLILGVRSLDIARRDADLAVRFARPVTAHLVCRKLGEVGFSLYASRRYLAKSGLPTRGRGLAGYDLIAFTGAPAATSPFFMGESLEGARIALRCNNPLIQLNAAANDIGIAELACFLGDTSPDLVRVWPREAPARRTVWLIVHQDMRHSARIRAVSAAIGDMFRRQRKILEQGCRGHAPSV